MGGLIEIRQGIIAASNGVLPSISSEYQQVEYIISQATAIDTGVPGNNPNLSFDFCFECAEYFQYGGIFGNFNNGQDTSWRMILSNSNNNAFFLSAYNKGADLMQIKFPSSIYGKRIYAKVKYHDVSAVIENVKTEHTPTTLTQGTERDYNIAVGYQRVMTYLSNNVRVKFYYFRIFDNGTLIRNYIPCYRKADNKVGFYDTVNKTFNTSTSTNEFELPS